MLEFGDSVYYIDINAFDKAITIVESLKKNESVETEVKTMRDADDKIISVEKVVKTSTRGKEVDATKYDLLKTFIDYIIDYEDITEDLLGADRALSKSSLGYKIVFNTLLAEGIIKEK